MNTNTKSGLLVFVAVSIAPSLGFAQFAENASSMAIEEIVVTARKRAESKQEVPISITALSGDALDKAAVVEMNDVGRLTTNVMFEGLDRTKALVFIRGLGTRTIGLRVSKAFGSGAN